MPTNSPQYRKDYSAKNGEQIRQNDRERYQRDKEKRLILSRKTYKNSIEKNPTKNTDYYKENKERIQARRKELKALNPEKYRKKYSDYIKKRKLIDPFFKMKLSLRGRISRIFSLNNTPKRLSTKKLLGVDFEIVKHHIERNFLKGMTWDNHGIWHIDHIIPLSSAKTEEDLIKLCHYTNLQPLWAADNISKKDKIPQVQLKIAI